MERKWTPGLLEAAQHDSEVQWAIEVKGEQFHYVALTSQGNDEANAKRLVACWNALLEVPDPSAFMESYREMRTALEPFAKFAETRERIPMRGLDDVIYQCHGGTEDEVSLRLSDCVRAHAALANADKLEGAGK